MADQPTKAGLIEALRSRRAELDALLSGVPPALLDEPGVAGDWSIKDIVAHLTYHDRWFADRLHESLRGETYRPTDMDSMDFDVRNDRIYRQHRGRPAMEVIAESRAVFLRLMAGVVAHTESFLIEPQRFEGVPEPVVVGTLLRGVVDHSGEHLAGLRNWLATRCP